MRELFIMPIGGPRTLLKNGDRLRPKSKIHSNDTQGKVPVPVFHGIKALKRSSIEAVLR